MNKVLNINLGGLPFTIDDEAYRMLENYLQSLHNHFRASEGYEEIMNDIEARLAELIQEGMGKRGIVTHQDVKNAVSVMGKPEDFGAEPVDETKSTTSQGSNTEGASRENREGTKKTGSTGGATFQVGKRLFRDDEHKMVGGVCAGLAAYFGIDVVWLRIIWGVLFFFAGTGAVLYFILWAVVPSAKTTADRLAMQGQPVDVNNIAKTVETSFEKFSEKVNEFGKPENQERFHQQVNHISSNIGNVIKAVFTGLGGVGRVIAIVMAVFLIIAMLLSWFGLTIAASFGAPLLGYVTDESWKGTLGGFNVFAIMASVSALLILAIRRLIYKRQAGTGIVAGLWTFLAINAFSLISLVGSVAQNFRYSYDNQQQINIEGTDTLTIVANLNKANGGVNFGDLYIADELIVDFDVNMRIERSENGKFELIKNNRSQGRNSEEAQRFAKSIIHNTTLSNNVLTIGESFQIPNGTKWRGQSVEMTLKVPDGKVIKYDRDLTGIIHWIERDDDDENDSNCLDSKMRVWKMTENGFVCTLTESDEDGRKNRRKKK
jgi:phage shock protein PspC (stress-responsive transcriptional regulator)